MRVAVLLLVALLVSAGAARAEGPERRPLDDLEAVGFRGVGRLNIAGRRFCTATLISDRQVLTAAHCLYNPATGRRVVPHEFRFVAGQRRDTSIAIRAVVRTAVLPGFRFGERVEWTALRHDLGLLELEAPVPGVSALPLHPGAVRGTGRVAIVSYARDRPWIASIQEVCPVRSAVGGVAILGCAVTFGASGAPVVAYEDGRLRLVAVVSAMGRDLLGANIALSVVAAPRMQALREALARSDR